ncbi:RICIN domain-containing protein [Streptomyces sp. NPDC049555]|uniref:RICIN domain-containing protein n=1 Tax=Streptomyces sp. NPDC049555 TaxID=3154930 RepID=UPI00343E6BAB
MELHAGVAYSFKNAKSGRYLNVEHGNDDDSRALITWHAYHDDATYDFYLYPTDKDHKRWWIGARCNGRFLFTHENDTLRQGRIYEAGLTSFEFAFESENGMYRIRNLRDDVYLREGMMGLGVVLPVPEGRRDGRVFTGDKKNDKSDLWIIEERRECKEITGLKPVPAAPNFGEIDHLTGFQEPKLQTDLIKLGAVALPPNLVKDGSHSNSWKMEHSPYYILTRYSQWTRQGFKKYLDGQTVKFEKDVTVGLVDTESTTIQEHTGIKVNAKAGFEYAGASASIETEVSHSLDVTTYRSTQFQQSTTEKATLTSEFKHGDKAITCWYRDNVFVLTRLTGTEILRWTTREPNTQVFDAWPKDVLAKH